MILDLLFIFPFFLFFIFTFCLLTYNFFSIHKCSIAAHSQHAAKQGFISTTEKQNKVIYYFFSFFSFFNRYKKNKFTQPCRCYMALTYIQWCILFSLPDLHSSFCFLFSIFKAINNGNNNRMEGLFPSAGVAAFIG